MPLSIIRNDITKMNVDAIVNAANSDLQPGGGVCGSIFKVAGKWKLRKECKKLAPIKTGDAVITNGFALPSKYIIHTVGPVYLGGNQNEEAFLRLCYKNTLDLALKYNCESIAFPLISSGTYGYPKNEALAIATSSISNWLMTDDMDVSLVVFDKEAFSLSLELHGKIKAFIADKYVIANGSISDRSQLLINQHKIKKDKNNNADIRFSTSRTPQHHIGNLPSMYDPQSQFSPHSDTYKGFAKNLDEPFSNALLRFIDLKGKPDVEIYKRANLDRKLFSKIRTGKGYMPSKKTAVALAVALELSLVETRDLLERAGFALSRSVIFDVIIEYFIVNRRYDIFEINNVLFEYDQPILGG